MVGLPNIMTCVGAEGKRSSRERFQEKGVTEERGHSRIGNTRGLLKKGENPGNTSSQTAVGYPRERHLLGRGTPKKLVTP